MSNFRGFFSEIKKAFIEGYKSGISEEIQKMDEKRTVIGKTGRLTGKIILAFRKALEKARKWYKERITVTTIGTIEEHSLNMAKAVGVLLSNAVNGVAFFVSLTVFGFASWITLLVAANWVMDLYQV